jgi:hypothetical protein
MHCEKDTIIFTIAFRGKEHQLQTRTQQYQSLMCLISDHFRISRFGICYGGGSCGTCGVEIKEKFTGKRKFILSCEIKIDDELVEKKVNIL